MVTLAKSLAELGHEVHVATFVGGGQLESELSSNANVALHNLEKPGIVGKITGLLTLRNLIRWNQYDVVYGFLPIPNLSLLVARTVRRRPVIAWGVRSSGIDLDHYGLKVKWAMLLERKLSRLPDVVITNSQTALEEYRMAGYPVAKLTHIPNAIDTKRFRANPNVRASIRTELGIPQDSTVIGIFARIHPMKDHATFLRAAALFSEVHPSAIFVIAGDSSPGYTALESYIKNLASQLSVSERVHWLGARNDPEKLMLACDVTTLTSNSGEGFPNSVAESMACGVPCVVTDVGDAAEITAGFTKVVQPNDPDGLADAWREAVQHVRNNGQTFAGNISDSISDRFSIAEIAQRTADQFLDR